MHYVILESRIQPVMLITKEITDFYKLKRTEHVDLVNGFAQRLGYNFPDHDADKFCDPIMSMIAPAVWCKACNIPRTEEINASAKTGVAIHKAKNLHHPEAWKNVADMTEIALIEMCCDWRAANAEKRTSSGVFGDTMDFYIRHALPEYKFTKSQQKFIEEILEKLR